MTEGEKLLARIDRIARIKAACREFERWDSRIPNLYVLDLLVAPVFTAGLILGFSRSAWWLLAPGFAVACLVWTKYCVARCDRALRRAQEDWS